MQVRGLAVLGAALAMGASVPAYATYGSSSGGWWTPPAHVHGPGCGHPGYGGSSSTSGGTTSTSSGGTSSGGSSFGGTTSGGTTSGGTTSGGTTSGGTTSGGTEVPEPADFALFGLGVAGLVIGRRSSRAGRPRAD